DGATARAAAELDWPKAGNTASISFPTSPMTTAFRSWDRKSPGRGSSPVYSPGVLLPFDGRGGFGADVVHHAVDAAHLVDDAVGDGGQQVIGEVGPVGRHAVLGMDGAQGAGKAVGAEVTHDPDAADPQQNGEGLPEAVVPAGALDLLDRDGVGLLQQVDFLRGHLAQYAHRQAGAGKGLTTQQLSINAQVGADAADFVLEELAQGLDQLQAHVGGQAADVVVAFDHRRGAADGDGLDHVGVESSLHQEVGVQAAGLGFEGFDKDPANDLALLFRVGDAGERGQEGGAGVHGDDIEAQLAAEVVLHLLELIETQQAVVDEHAHQA